jgi:nucleotide-binding universal stress UspA family protein
MKTIVVPTDFSDISNNAIDYAVDLAKATGCSILVFHAYQVPLA